MRSAPLSLSYFLVSLHDVIILMIIIALFSSNSSLIVTEPFSCVQLVVFTSGTQLVEAFITSENKSNSVFYYLHSILSLKPCMQRISIVELVSPPQVDGKRITDENPHCNSGLVI